MTKYDLLYAIGEADEVMVEQAKQKKQPSRRLWMTAGALAACLVMLMCTVMLFPGNRTVTHYGERNHASSSLYPVPSAGEVIFTSQVTAAWESYQGKNVTYLLTFRITEQYAPLTEEQEAAEYERLMSLGYELYTVEKWSYRVDGERYYYDVVAGRFTEEQLRAFEVNPEYGYFFDFVTNGNGSPIPFYKYDAVTYFKTDYR